MALVLCKGCGTRQVIARAPPGSLPEGWVQRSGSAYCEHCSGDAPMLYMTPRMMEAATEAVIEACSQDPALRAAIDSLRASQRPDSSAFVRAVRAAVEAACAPGAERFPVALRALFSDVLACVSWFRVAEHIARSGSSMPVPTHAQRVSQTTATTTTTSDESDPFAL
jgi:hypothetical protein